MLRGRKKMTKKDRKRQKKSEGPREKTRRPNIRSKRNKKTFTNQPE